MKKKGEKTKAGGQEGTTPKRRENGRARKPPSASVKSSVKSPAKSPVKSPAKPRPASRTVLAAASKSARDKGTIRQLRSALSRALRLIQQLQASAETDFLLGILNRRGFERELTRAIAYIKRYHAGAALIILDVDRLKPINDAFGHGAGD